VKPKVGRCRPLWFALFFLATTLLHAQPARKAQPTYAFAVAPQFAPSQIQRNWAPLLAYLQQATGATFELKVFNSFPEFENSFLQADVDFVYLNPYHMIMAHQAHDYIPLVRDKEMLSGILVTRADNPVRKVWDLAGKTIAFPSPNAFAASLRMRALLTEQFRIQIRPLYANTHSAAYLKVVAGQAAAAGGIRASLNKEPEQIRSQLRILYETPAVPSHPVAVHPRVPDALRNSVRQALQQLSQSPEKGLLEAISISEFVAADYLRDYAPLETLGLEKYIVIEK